MFVAPLKGLQAFENAQILDPDSIVYKLLSIHFQLSFNWMMIMREAQ